MIVKSVRAAIWPLLMIPFTLATQAHAGWPKWCQEALAGLRRENPPQVQRMSSLTSIETQILEQTRDPAFSGREFTVETHHEFFESGSQKIEGTEIARIARYLGGPAALAHATNLHRLRESSLSHFLEQTRQGNHAVVLPSSGWPLKVAIKDGRLSNAGTYLNLNSVALSALERNTLQNRNALFVAYTSFMDERLQAEAAIRRSRGEFTPLVMEMRILRPSTSEIGQFLLISSLQSRYHQGLGDI